MLVGVEPLAHFLARFEIGHLLCRHLHRFAGARIAADARFALTSGECAETAQTQLSAGADVLTGSAQQVVGAIDAVQAAGMVWFGTQSDQSGNWPETVVASQVYNWTPTIGMMVERCSVPRSGKERVSMVRSPPASARAPSTV